MKLSNSPAYKLLSIVAAGYNSGKPIIRENNTILATSCNGKLPPLVNTP